MANYNIMQIWRSLFFRHLRGTAALLHTPAGQLHEPLAGHAARTDSIFWHVPACGENDVSVWIPGDSSDEDSRHSCTFLLLPGCIAACSGMLDMLHRRICSFHPSRKRSSHERRSHSQQAEMSELST